MTKTDMKTNDKTKTKKQADKDAKYTDPGLRKRLKDEIQQGDKGGREGQWSARKSQLLVNEYEKAGGGYTSGKRSKTQTDLEDWGDEEWTTKDGKKAVQGDTTHRYLPKAAWDRLSDAEKEATDAKKVRDDDGKTQYVANTKKAKDAGRAARKDAKKSGGGKKSGRKKSESKAKGRSSSKQK